jgi:hypothetical protein
MIAICESLQNGTENPDQPILNKQSFILSGHFSFVPRVTVEYKFNYIVCTCLFSVSIEGYGDDRQQELDAFPFSQPVVRDDDAELRHKLKDMSGGIHTLKI